MKIISVIILYLILFNYCLFAQKINSEFNILCVPDSLLSIDNILPGDDISKILRIWGKPISNSNNEDFPTLNYEHSMLHLCGNTLGMIEVFGGGIETKQGIQIGLNKEQIISKININSSELSIKDLQNYFSKDSVILIGGCDSFLFTGMELKFNKKDILKQILIGYDCP